MATLAEAIKLCAGFQRCMNYPKDEDGIAALARGLMRASNLIGPSMTAIVEECLSSSLYCPTDADMLGVARDLRGPANFEEVPIPKPDEVRKQWHSLMHQFPAIMENSRVWWKEYRDVCAKVRSKMGERWLKATTREKVRVAIEMGMQVKHHPLPSVSIEDCGLGIFVEFNEL